MYRLHLESTPICHSYLTIGEAPECGLPMLDSCIEPSRVYAPPDAH